MKNSAYVTAKQSRNKSIDFELDCEGETKEVLNYD